MKFLEQALWAAVATAVTAGGAAAQLGGAGGTGGTGGTGGLTSLLSSLGGGGGGGQAGGGGTGGGQGGGGTGGVGGPINSGSAVTITAPSQVAQAPQSVATSNVIGKYYANPMYQGRAGTTTTSLTSVVNPGGFGAPLYGTNLGASTASGATGGRGGAAGGFGGTTGGTTGGFGGTTGGGGFGTTTGGNARGAAGGLGGVGGMGAANQANQLGQVVNQGAPGISYTASIKFSVPAVPPAQFQADMQAILDRTSSLSNPAGIQLTAANGVVTLRGRVKDEDEARLIDGLFRISPGVRNVTNELQFPRP